ncbi:MAG: hypothetical protein IH885_09935, partial [Myxococcales bacterium]|nr:hypothetical protein [Myxococcales bacterium]
MTRFERLQPWRQHFVLLVATWFAALLSAGCAERDSDAIVLTADLPLHLEDHLNVAKIEGSEVPEDVPHPVEWNFDTPQTDWKPVVPLLPAVEPVQPEYANDALRINLTEATEYPVLDDISSLCGGIYTEIPDWKREDWSDILVRARTSDEIEEIYVGFNLRDEIGNGPYEYYPFRYSSEGAVVVRDGTEQTYAMRADWSMDYFEQWEGPWRQLG